MRQYLKIAMLAIGAGMVMASCSDNDNKYADDIYFTGTQQSIVSIGKTGGQPSIGNASTWVCFDAASNWQISAMDASDPGKQADWVSFLQPSGDEGSHRVGVYATDNTGSDRAAMIQVSCAGKNVQFLLVQQGKSLANPNTVAINKKKVVNKIEYFAKDATSAYKTVSLSYPDGGIAETITTVNGDETKVTNYTATYNGVKLVVAETNEVYATLDSIAFKGYNTLSINHLATAAPINFEYADGSVKTISGAANATYTWTASNLTGLQTSDNSYKLGYGEVLNDATIDLNWFITDADGGATPGSHALQVLNLLGKRSANLVSSCGSLTYTYAEEPNALVITVSNGETIKVTYNK